MTVEFVPVSKYDHVKVLMIPVVAMINVTMIIVPVSCHPRKQNTFLKHLENVSV